MGSVRCRGNRWHAQVRLSGFRSFTKSFSSREDAEKWCCEQERFLRDTSFNKKNSSHPVLFSGLCTRYLEQRSRFHKGYTSEKCRIDRFVSSPLGNIQIAYITPEQIFDYMETRRHTVSLGSLRKEYFLLKNILNFAKLGYGISPSNNPLDSISVPRDSNPRDRRLEPHEKVLLETAFLGHKNIEFANVCLLALDSGMRRSEILKLSKSDFSASKQTLLIRESKNGDNRVIPLSKRATAILSNQEGENQNTMFSITPSCVHQAWKRLTKKLELEDLRFHDLRHEAISTFFEKGLSVAEVQVISGHRDVRQLFRYTHIRAEEIIKRYDL